jgi:hypothetical protein
MKKILLSIHLTIVSTSAYAANGIDVTAAFGDAFILVSLKFVLAFFVFYVLTFGLRGKAKNTALKNARWFGAILSSAANARQSKSADYDKAATYVAAFIFVC